MEDPSVEYETRYGARFIDALGDGKDGFIRKTAQGHAVKFFHDSDSYRRELRAYLVLRKLSLDQVGGHQIPRLLRYDDQLMAIAMTVVKPPFLLDFAAAYTEAEVARFGFTTEVLEEREQHWSEVFGGLWPAVAELRYHFERQTGLILLDLSLNNIKFG